MVYKDPLKLYITKRADTFGYFINLFVENSRGERAVATELTLQNIKPGEIIPESGSLPINEDSLRDFGQYLIAQGLVAVPVTDRERNEHEQLKIKFEMQEKLTDQMREQLKDSNTRLSEIAGVVKLAQDLTNKEAK